MKTHLIDLHKSLAQFHDKCSKLHKGHADALADDDPHAAVHHGLAALHKSQAEFHRAQATVIDELPNVAAFDPGGHGKAAWVPSDPRAPMGKNELETEAEDLDPEIRKAVV